MTRWRLIFGALTLFAVAAGGTGAAAASPHAELSAQPMLSMNFTHSGGSGALSGADVAVYYLPFDPARHGHDPEMGTGTTDLAGQATVTLNTSMVQTADLADVAGHRSFNALVVAETDGWTAVETVVVRDTGTTTADVAARAVPATAQAPALPERPADQIVGSTYRYVTIGALNSADGIQAGLQYTWTSETSRQTTLGVAGSYEGGAWSESGTMTEQTSRSVDAPWRRWNVYHQYVFANYFFQKHYIQLGIKAFEYLWEPDHFAGQVTDDDPNVQRSGTVIGKVSYSVPGFTNCNGNCWFIMTRNNSGWGRDSGTRASYRFDMAVAGWLSLEAEATYGSITYVHWYWQSKGCSGGYSRVIWGDNLDPEAARIVQADCMPTPVQ